MNKISGSTIWRHIKSCQIKARRVSDGGFSYSSNYRWPAAHGWIAVINADWQQPVIGWIKLVWRYLH